ncbi:MAG: glycosyltransferase family 9 protein [Flavobacteriaceae bacterium]|nr:glycosyltransferase family 9 protein [Flavobacteriaceae bacterium]
MTNTSSHILVIRLSAMGDVAMTVPVILAMRNQFPEAQITVVTRKAFIPIFAHLNDVSVLSVDSLGRHKGIMGLWQLSKEIHALRPSMIADLHNVLRSKMLRFFLKDYRWAIVDKGRKDKHLAVNQGKEVQLQTTHERYADVFRNLGFDLNLADFVLPRTKLNLPSGIQTKPIEKWIGFAPFAGYLGKTYPLDLSAQLIARLEKQATVVLFGGGEEETKALNDLASKFEKVTCYAGQLNLSEEIQLISNLDMMIAMDSSNGHLAAMLGVEVISIWGITHPILGFAPFGQPGCNSLVADKSKFNKIPTSVYGNKMPQGYENAIRTITPEMIDQLVQERLKHRHSPPSETHL